VLYLVFSLESLLALICGVEAWEHWHNRRNRKGRLVRTIVFATGALAHVGLGAVQLANPPELTTIIAQLQVEQGVNDSLREMLRQKDDELRGERKQRSQPQVGPPRRPASKSMPQDRTTNRSGVTTLMTPSASRSLENP
jgi:hypothetical protein